MLKTTVRSLFLVCFTLGLVLAAARPAMAQTGPRLLGGGIGYSFDEHEDFLEVTAIAWLPVRAPETLAFKPFVLVPRVQVNPGIDRWVAAVGGVWDIPVVPELMIHPYMGVGVGIAHDPDNTTPIATFNAGFRIKKPNWDHQFAAEIHYSAGLDFHNEMVLNFVVMFPVGRH